MRPIDADVVLKRIKNAIAFYSSPTQGDFDTGRKIGLISAEEIVAEEPTLKREGCCICGADRQMFQLKCSNTKQTLYICWDCAKDIAEQHFSEQNVKIEARWKEVEPHELICTNCGGYAPMNYMHEHYVETTFCPHCGAKMRGKLNE